MSNGQIEVAGGEPPAPRPAPADFPPHFWVLRVGFDPQTQGVAILKDDEKILSWEMIIGILNMALVSAEFNRNMGQSQKQQGQMMQMLQDQMLAAQVAQQGRKGKLHV